LRGDSGASSSDIGSGVELQVELWLEEGFEFLFGAEGELPRDSYFQDEEQYWVLINI
jgi:hypothetical protein